MGLGPGGEVSVGPFELDERALAAECQGLEGAKARVELGAGEADRGQIGVVEQGAGELEVTQEVEQVGQRVVRGRWDGERPGVADADHEARGVGCREEFAGELDACRHGPATGALLADPGDHGVAGDVRAVAGEQVGAGEGAVERV